MAGKLNFRELVASRCKTFSKDKKVKTSIPDPSGEQSPIKVNLMGVVDPTDEGYHALALAQDASKPINGKQKLPDTESGIGGTQIHPFHPTELGEVIQLLVENTAEELASLQEEERKAAEEAEGKRKTKKSTKAAQEPPVNRVAEAVGASESNGQS